MVMIYEAKMIADMARWYHLIKVSEQDINAPLYNGPSGIILERIAKKHLMELLEFYKKVPREIREHLDIDISKIERIIS